jgi:hypothetical protein
MHHYSPSSRWLAVPGIGFPQNISVGPNVLEREHFRDRSFTARCKRDGQHDAAAQLNRLALISVAMAFGPLVSWWLSRRLTAES